MLFFFKHTTTLEKGSYILRFSFTRVFFTQTCAIPDFLFLFFFFLATLQSMMFKCAKCDQLVSRLYRLRLHASSKHGLADGSEQMNDYMQLCTKLNKRGVRTTSVETITKQLGAYGFNRALVDACRSLLANYAVCVQECSQVDEQLDYPAASPTPRPRQTRAHISTVGLVAHFSEIGRIATEFKKLETSKVGRSKTTAAASANMIHRFFDWAQRARPSLNDAQILTSLTLPEEFNKIMHCTFKAYTVKNHAAAMSTLIDTILWNNEFREKIGIEAKLKRPLGAAKRAWEMIKNQSQKQARAAQRRKIRGGHFQNVPILCILRFLMEYSRQCETDFGDITEARRKAILMCVGATYLALHGQRLCAVLNMTSQELNTAVSTKGRFVVRVQAHKTAKISGPAAIALKPHQYHTLVNIASTCAINGYLFKSAASGRASQQLFAPLNEFIQEKFPDAENVTCNAVRKTISTNMFLVKDEGSNTAEALINSYLCHGKKVTELHYAFLTEDRVVSQARTVERVISALAAQDLVREDAVKLPNAHGKRIFLCFFHS